MHHELRESSKRGIPEPKPNFKVSSTAGMLEDSEASRASFTSTVSTGTTEHKDHQNCGKCSGRALRFGTNHHFRQFLPVHTKLWNKGLKNMANFEVYYVDSDKVYINKLILYPN